MELCSLDFKDSPEQVYMEEGGGLRGERTWTIVSKRLSNQIWHLLHPQPSYFTKKWTYFPLLNLRPLPTTVILEFFNSTSFIETSPKKMPDSNPGLI